jgi:hypothetical protein
MSVFMNIESSFESCTDWSPWTEDSTYIFRMSDPDEQVRHCNSIILSVFQDNIPLKQCFVKDPISRWMNSEIARLIVEHGIANNIWDKNKTEENRKLILLQSKNATKSIRSSLRDLYDLDPNLPFTLARFKKKWA